MPPYVTNHGVMDQGNFTELLRNSRLYVGLGQPVEGPAPLEAIGNGVTFLNPKCKTDCRVHEGKPTNRSLTSQHPYVEEFIGKGKTIFMVQYSLHHPTLRRAPTSTIYTSQTGNSILYPTLRHLIL